MRKIILSAILAMAVTSLSASALSELYTFDSGFYPRGLIIADINADGKNEVVVANFGEDTLIGQENDAEPSPSITVFSETGITRLVSGACPRGLADAYLDKDKACDFAATNYADGTITVYTEKGASSETLSAGKHPVGIDIGDLAGDGAPEIAAAVYSDNKAVIFSREADGRWAKKEVSVPGAPTDVVIGKIDGQSVLVTANYGAASVSVIKIENSLPVKLYDLAVGNGPCKVEIADVTADGKNDLVVSNFHDNTVSIAQSGADGKLYVTSTLKLNGTRPNGMAVGDIDNDGKPEIVAANRDSDTIDILAQNAQGVYEVSLTITVTADERKEYGPVEVALGDINNDGLADIAFTHMRSNTLRILYQKPAEKDGKPRFAEAMSEHNTYNFPNPASEKTTIRFSSDKKADVTITVYDSAGAVVWEKKIGSEYVVEGVNYCDWDLRDKNSKKVANGAYVVKVSNGSVVVTKKIAVLK